jgi:hypothetical protein
MRFEPSKVNGLVTTATVRMPSDRATSAITGAAPVPVVTKPFTFEGSKRMKSAEQGLDQLAPHTDSLIVILNDKLEEVLALVNAHWSGAELACAGEHGDRPAREPGSQKVDEASRVKGHFRHIVNDTARFHGEFAVTVPHRGGSRQATSAASGGLAPGPRSIGVIGT